MVAIPEAKDFGVCATGEPIINLIELGITTYNIFDFKKQTLKCKFNFNTIMMQFG
jgi:hypothetical protein